MKLKLAGKECVVCAVCGVMTLLNIASVYAEELDLTFTWASRIQYFDWSEQSFYPRHFDSGHTQLDNRLISELKWKDWFLIAQTDYSIWEGDSEIDGTFNEFLWAPSVSDSTLVQLGKINLDFDQSQFIRPLGFFQTPASPFDDFASTEGLWMISTSHFLGDWVINTVLSEDAHDFYQQGNAQWGLIVQRDFANLSVTGMMQQYEGQKVGVGGSFSYAKGLYWSFTGSAFLREGSVYLDQVVNTQPTSEEVSFSERRGWMPRLSLGAQWSGQHHRYLLEWIYDHRRLERDEQAKLYDLTSPSNRGNVGEGGNSQLIERFSKESAKLLADRHQQQYLFGQYQYSQSHWNAQINSLVGYDGSQLWQLKYSWLPTWSLTLYCEWSTFVGDDDTEFGRVTVDQQVSVGVQWVF